MGRGGRDERAIAVSALPRLARRAKEPGQRRYLVERIDKNKNYRREPGFARGFFEFAAGSDRSLLVTEEIAVQGKDGSMHWLPTRESIYRGYISEASSLKEARKIVNHLNKEPLGAVVTKEVDDQGNLLIGYGTRRLSRSYSDRDITTIEYSEERKKFDVTDPVQAEKAKKCYDDMTQRLGEERLRVSNHYLDSMADSAYAVDRKLAKQIIGQEDEDKAEAAQRFADALDDGTTEQIEAELRHQKTKEDQVEQKEVASRMQRTIDGLRAG